MRFVYNQPVLNAPHHVGREQLHKNLLSGVQNQRSFVLIGGPRSGKSSELIRLHDRMWEHIRRQPHQSPTVPVYLDFSKIKAQPFAVLSAVCEGVLDAVCNPRRPGAPMRPSKVQLRSNSPLQDLHEILKNIRDQMRGTPGLCAYTFLLDNLDTLVDYNVQPGGLIATLIDQDHAFPSANFIATGGRTLREYMFDEPSFAKAARLLNLGTLSQSDGETLLKRSGLKLEEAEVQLLIYYSGLNPFILQRLGAELQQQGETIDIELAVDRAYGHLAPVFEKLWQDIDLGRQLSYADAYAAPEHILLQAMLKQRRAFALKEAEKELQMKPLKEYFEFFEFAGLCQRKLRANTTEWRCEFGLFNEWYLDRITK